MITITITANAVEVLSQVRTWPARMMRAVVRELDRQNEYTVGSIISERMSQRGAETLGVVTGRGRSSVRRTPALEVPGGIYSAIGSNVGYIGAHERGFEGDVTVRAHERQLYQVKRAARAATFDPATGKITKARKALRKSAGVAVVHQHTRHVRIKPRRMIQRGIEARRENYGAAISKVIVDSWKKDEQ